VIPTQRYLDRLDKYQSPFEIDALQELLKKIGF